VSDAPKTKDDEVQIELIRSYIDSIHGFKKVYAINRETNVGSFFSVNLAIDYIFEKSDRLIFIEDDNIVSSNFLAYINDCLEIFKNNHKIFSVCGYNYPINIPASYNKEIYFWPGYSGWGVGLWKEKWSEIDWSKDYAIKFLRNPVNLLKSSKIAGHYNYHFLNYVNNNHLAGDVAICLNLVSKNMYSVFPSKSKVRNMGTDGSGEHGVQVKDYSLQFIDNRTYAGQIDEEIMSEKVINSLLRYHFKIGLKSHYFLIKSIIRFYINNTF
jgi:hypothetical protein